MAAQVGERQRRAPARQVGRRRAGDAVRAAEFAGDEVRLWHGADPDRHVEAFLDQVDLAVRQRDVELHQRVRLRVGADDVRQPVLAVRQRDRHPQHALRRARQKARYLFRFVHVGHDLGAALVEGAPGFGQAQAPRGAVEQARAQVFFQLLDLLRDHRPRDAALVRRRRETAAVHHRHIHAHCRKQVHRRRLSSKWK